MTLKPLDCQNRDTQRLKKISPIARAGGGKNSDVEKLSSTRSVGMDRRAGVGSEAMRSNLGSST